MNYSDEFCYIIITFLIYIPLVVVAILFFIQAIRDIVFHVPRTPLTDNQISEMCKYGIIHFTTIKSAKSIINDRKICKCERRARYPEEKNMTWFLPCHQPVDCEYINQQYSAISNIRKKSDICINVIDIQKSEASEYLYEPNYDYIAHNGDLQKTMTFYVLKEGKWIKTLDIK